MAARPAQSRWPRMVSRRESGRGRPARASRRRAAPRSAPPAGTGSSRARQPPRRWRAPRTPPRWWWPSRCWPPAPGARSPLLPGPVAVTLLVRRLTGGGHLGGGGLAQRALRSVLRDARLPRGDAARAEQVVVAFGRAEPHRVRRRLHRRLERGEQLLLGPDQALPVVIGDLVDVAVPLAGRVALVLGVVRPLHVDGVGGAGPGAQLAADAFLQPVRPPVQLVAAVEPRHRGFLLLWVLDGVDLPEHLPEGDAEALDGAQELRHR